MDVKKAKEHCGYTAKPVLPVCGNCGAFTSERKLPAWMVEYNKNQPGNCSVEDHGGERNMRCTDHGFAVKKMASCKLWRHA